MPTIPSTRIMNAEIVSLETISDGFVTTTVNSTAVTMATWTLNVLTTAQISISQRQPATYHALSQMSVDVWTSVFMRTLSSGGRGATQMTSVCTTSILVGTMTISKLIFRKDNGVTCIPTSSLTDPENSLTRERSIVTGPHRCSSITWTKMTLSTS